MGPLHGRAIRRIAEALRMAISDSGMAGDFEVAQQTGFAVAGGRPTVLLPDIAVLRSTDADRVDENPSWAALIIEVAVSTLPRDLSKAAGYGLGVETFWVVDLTNGTVVV